jgi:hypothetical protein
MIVVPPPTATGRRRSRWPASPPVLAALKSAGGEVVDGPAPAPNGARLIARQPDGAIFEYIETGEGGSEGRLPSLAQLAATAAFTQVTVTRSAAAVIERYATVGHGPAA